MLLIGGSGLVGSRILELLNKRFEFVAPSHSELDVLNPSQVKKAIREIKPSQVLYAAGFTNVDLAEEKKEECFALNAKAPGYFVEVTGRENIPFCYISTDYVFNGKQSGRPYKEDDPAGPIDQVYARSKYDGEQIVLNGGPINSVLRIVMPFSAVFTKKTDLARFFVTKLKNKEKIKGIYNQKINPIFADDLAAAIGKTLEARVSGIYHLAAIDYTTPYDYAKSVAKVFNLDERLIERVDFNEYVKTRPAKRPQHTWLDTAKFREEFGEGILHTIDEEIKLFKRQLEQH